MTPDNQWPRVLEIEGGIAMIVTDLHGDWDAYQRYRDRFLHLHAREQAHYLVLCGDLIHHQGPPEEDSSLEMVLDVLSLQNELGSRLVYLLGNHEMPHIYSIPLQKGNHIYTPSFEAVMGRHRQKILALFDSLPFYVRTPAGVSICHAGATAEIGTSQAQETLFNFSHQQVWQEAEKIVGEINRASLRQAVGKLNGQPYEEMVRRYFAITTPDDPRYDHFLVGTVASNSHPHFDLLWSALFTRNEYQYGDDTYVSVVNVLLQALSTHYHPQTALVSGHIACQGGYTLVADKQQLRLASGQHAHPREAGVYLLFDTEKKVKTAEELLPGLGTVFA